MKSMLSNIFLIVAATSFLVLFFLLYQTYNPKRLEFNSKNIPTQIYSLNNQAYPGWIYIPEIKVSLPVLPAEKKGNNWPTTDKGISYLINSPIPGDQGNAILYGHNWESLLGNLKKVKEGDKIIINLFNGEKRTFIIDFIKEVNRNETYVLDSKSDKRITLFTCSGFFDQNRLVVSGKLNSIQAKNLPDF